MRLTKIFEYLSNKVIAEGTLENSAYASSTINKPPTFAAALAHVSISVREIAAPVGLFGVVIKVSAGFTSAI